MPDRRVAVPQRGLHTRHEQRRLVAVTADGGISQASVTDLGGSVDAEAARAQGTHRPDVVWEARVGSGEDFVGFDGATCASDLAAAARATAPGGRLLVLHDYGRDDASKLLHSQVARAERVAWSRADGWFMGNGFKLRVIHCWWTWESVDRARAELEEVFGSDAAAVASAMRRPRLEHKVAIYHRSLEGA